jgi:tricorn protease
VLHRFSFEGRKVTPWGQGIGEIKTNPDGTKALVSGFGGTSVVSTLGPISGGAPVAVGDLRVKINPLDEWRRMYWLAVKKQKLSFYDPNVHGVDLTQVAKRYEAFLPHLKTRADLNYLFTEVMGEISVGHMFISGGDNGPAGVPSVPGGLLGADFKFENGRYRLTRVFDGERWNPELYAPLAQPGVEAKAGEYLLEVNGKELRDSTDIYEALEAKAGKQVRVKLGPTPDGKGAREVTVLPVADESNLRFRAWSEDNRRRVFEATGGRVGYVHVPDTNVGGWREFMRYYYAQSGMDGMVVDERFNHGGAIADFLVREMIRPQVAGSRTRYGKDWRIPALGVYGPKVMIINEMSGSGGDIFPHMFRFHKAGTIVGKRTWGAMISNYGFSLPDGANISTPDDAMYNPDGTWMIENIGTPPDIEVELDPAMWRLGKDSQVEAAISEILKQLAQNPKKPIKRPDYPAIPPFKPGG